MNWIALSYLALAFALSALLLPAARLRLGGYVLAGWAAGLLVLIGAGSVLAGAPGGSFSLNLSILPNLGFALDSIRAYFLAIAAAVYVFSIAFVAHDSGHYTRARGQALLVWTTLLYAAMIAVILSATVLSLLFTWELMSLALWALVTFEARQKPAMRAGLLTLGLSEAGALAALAGLLMLAAKAGSTQLAAIAAHASKMPPGVIWAAFLLTFFGFGVKTGIVPVNVWMSDGYAAAPRSLRPLFSGATMNLGVFTLWIVDGPLASHALGPALVVLTVGALTAILGIVYALVARDMGRLLTQSSIENLGIVTAALGAGFAFAALGHPVPAGMALVAGLYHMLNHSAYKTCLFLGAGGIDAVAGTHDLDRLGGLMRRLPVFGTLFLIGTLAIAALPPFNGFVSEWLTLESLLRVVEVGSVPVRITFALSGAVLALTAGLAMTCFIMLAGSSLLGLPRSPEAGAAGRMPWAVTAPMAVLVAICFGLGILATGVIPVLGHLAAPLAGTDPTSALVPDFFTAHPHLPADIVTDLSAIGVQVGRGVAPLRGLAVLHSGGHTTPVVFAMSTGLGFAVIATILGLVWAITRLRRHRVHRATLWDAGLTRLHPEMTYNTTAFAAPVRNVFNTILRPAVDERVEQHGAFATAYRRDVEIPHIVDRLTLEPLIRHVNRLAETLAGLHHGCLSAYAAYALVTLIAALIASTVVL